MILAINKTHQRQVNKVVNYLVKYNTLNDQRNDADGNDEKLYKKLDRLCQSVFDKYLTELSELPKREQQNIEKSELY